LASVYGEAVGCVGSVCPVFDGPAAAFAVAFSKVILDGHPLGKAVRRTREMSLDADPNQLTWATYVLYGYPRYRSTDDRSNRTDGT
jgi:hypothetical protein